MKTLIVPCAGSRIIDSRPIFLNRHPDGELLAIKTILGVFPDSYDRIVYTVLKRINEEFNAQDEILQANNNRFPIDVIVLEGKTNGPAETVYKTLKQGNIEGEFAVRDSHAYISIGKKMEGNFIAGLDLTKYEKPIEHLRGKSFIVLNEQGQTLDVIEKHFCSDVISVGLYGFKKASDFLMAFEHLNDPNYPIDKLFVSHIISYLIGYKQRVFHSIQVSEFEDWGSKTSWQRVQKNHSTCFLDLDCICEKNKPISEELLKNLKQLSDSGVMFVPFTSKSIDDGISTLIRNQGINLLPLVCNCSTSRIKTIACSADDITEMTLEI